MICVSIIGPTLEEARNQIAHVQPYADLIELRLDHFIHLNLVDLKQFRNTLTIPVIFTLRKVDQGGKYTDSEDNRLSMLRELMTLDPDYLDLEYDVPQEFIQMIQTQHPNIKLILSYHNFIETPSDLDQLYMMMRQVAAHFYKIAVTANSTLEALRLVAWAKQADPSVVAISMGLYGTMSRILAPVIGRPMTYAAVEDHQQSAPGQLSAQTLVERYYYHRLFPHTQVYGLIGDPVDRSISDETHNHFFAAHHLAAVYIKMIVRASELREFLIWAKKIPFSGLSVTMPLKESIFDYLHCIDDQALAIGSVNTLYLKEGEWVGSNTDGIGALNAIEEDIDIKGKHLVLIGAGGAARAIAYEAIRRGARVSILNRNYDRAHEIAQLFGCQAKRLEQMEDCVKQGYDILINCTPISMPIDPGMVLPGTHVMDITTYPAQTPFLLHAKESNSHVIYGYRMFVEQAMGQFSYWFKQRICLQTSKNFLKDTVMECISIK